MNHGGLGYLDEDGLVLPTDVLRPLHIADGSRLEGVYYPRKPEYPPSQVKHDFMITPIPFRRWPHCARLIVRLKHVPGAMAAVAAFLAQHGVSILTAECSRSAHRYATWNMTVYFTNDIDPAKPGVTGFDKTRSVHGVTFAAVEDLKADLEKAESLKKWLYVDSDDLVLVNPTMAIPICALSYFHHEQEEPPPVPPSDRWLYEHFALTYRDGVLRGRSDRFRNVVRHLGRQDGTDKETIVPAVVFAEMDQGDANLRVALIPRSGSHRFVKVRAEYQRAHQNKFHSKGLLAHITGALTPAFNIWRVWNTTTQDSKHSEEGALDLILEDMADDTGTADQTMSRAQSALSACRTMPTHLDHLSISAVRVAPLDPALTKEQLLAEKRHEGLGETGVFLSYPSSERERAAKINAALLDKGVRTFMASEDLRAGDQWPEILRARLTEAREVCLIYTPACDGSKWVTSEWHAAWFLRKRIAVLKKDLTFEQLPRRLAASHVYDFEDHLRYVEEVAERFRR